MQLVWYSVELEPELAPESASARARPRAERGGGTAMGCMSGCNCIVVVWQGHLGLAKTWKKRASKYKNRGRYPIQIRSNETVISSVYDVK